MSAPENAVNGHHYGPYGNLLSLSGPLAQANRYRFSSKEWSENTGLYYYGYRFYDPSLQRWLNQDSMEELGGYNLFAFISNVAVNAMDAFGLCDDNSNKDLSPKNPLDHFLNSNPPWISIAPTALGVNPWAS